MVQHACRNDISTWSPGRGEKYSIRNPLPTHTRTVHTLKHTRTRCPVSPTGRRPFARTLYYVGIYMYVGTHTHTLHTTGIRETICSSSSTALAILIKSVLPCPQGPADDMWHSNHGPGSYYIRTYIPICDRDSTDENHYRLPFAFDRFIPVACAWYAPRARCSGDV